MTQPRRTATLLASLLLAGPAFAQPPGKTPSNKDKQIAGELTNRAIAKSNSGDHSAAIDIYLQAYTIIPDSILLSNIGSEFLHSGKPREALRYFCMYLSKDPTGAIAPYAVSQAKALQIQLGNTEVDEQDVCVPAKPVKPKTRPRAEPRPKQPPAEDPESDADADIEPKDAKSPARTTSKAPARTAAKAQPPGDPPDRLSDSSEDRARGNPTLRYAGLAVGAAGLVGLGFGTYYGIRAYSISTDVSNYTSNPGADLEKLQRTGQQYEDKQIRALIVGGVLVTGGLVMYLLGRPGPSDSADDRTLTVTPTTNGFAVFGRF